MKILHVTPYFYPAWGYGGPPRAVYEIAKEQRAAGHSVTVLTTNAYEKDKTLPLGETSIDGITVLRLQNISNFLMWQFHFSTPIGVYEYLRKNSFDCIHLHEVRTLLNYWVLQFAQSRHFFISPWGTLPYNNSQVEIKKFLDLLLLPLLRQKLSAAFVQTEHEAQVVCQFDLTRNIHLVPLGVSAASFKNLPSRQLALQTLDLDPSKYYLLFLGRFSPYKGLDKLLSAFHQFSKTHSQLELLLVGRDDGFQNQLEKLVKTLQLEHKVKILPPLYDKDRFLAYRAANAFVFTPTVYEETGTVCLEALCCGLPILTTVQAEIPFVTEKDGVVHCRNTSSAIYKAMCRLPFLAQRVQPQHILRIFSWERIADQLLAHYKRK